MCAVRDTKSNGITDPRQSGIGSGQDRAYRDSVKRPLVSPLLARVDRAMPEDTLERHRPSDYWPDTRVENCVGKVWIGKHASGSRDPAGDPKIVFEIDRPKRLVWTAAVAKDMPVSQKIRAAKKRVTRGRHGRVVVIPLISTRFRAEYEVSPSFP